jgi:hypothetical protein
MSTSPSATERDLALPEDLERRLYDFRSLVWRIKLVEALCGAACGVLVGYLIVFGLDRVTETPWWVRTAAFAAAVAACAAIPVAFHRWVWSHRALDQLARLIAKRFPSMGDQLLGIIEIVRSAAGSRDGAVGAVGSRRLCAAAVAQVAEQSTRYDFSAAVPRPRHRLWLGLAVVPVAAAALAACFVPEAAANAWARFLAPWRAVERFTFARIDAVPTQIVVPRGEPATLDVALAADTRTRPEAARVRVGRQPPLAAPLATDGYAFSLPPQLAEAPLAVAVGDARARARVVPMLRPEITEVVAEVRLPDYLERPEPQTLDVRSGLIAPVKGSRVALVATANRDLAGARVNGSEVTPAGASVRTPAAVADAESKITIEWRDGHGLEGARPLVVQVTPRVDEAPTLVLAGLPAGRDVLLSSDTLRFTIGVADDFGIRRVGIEWQGDAGDASRPADRGERPLMAGGPDKAALEVAATFCPDALGVRPQPLAIRAFAEDYLPGRGRVYSAPFLVYVVDKAEHALVMNERLGRWRQQAAEVRDREQALLAGNTELRKLPAEQLLDAEARRRLEQQAAAEDAQERRMDRLVEDGEKLVREALKNPEFEAATLERLAEDIQTLADIGDNRMPSVADLLRAAAAARQAKAGEPSAGKPGESGKPAEGQAGKPKTGDQQQAGGQQQPGTQQPGEQQPGGQPRPDELAGQQDDTPADGQPPGEQPPRVGPERGQQAGGKPADPQEGGQPPVPQVVDRESSQQPPGPDEAGGSKSGGSGQGRLGLPSTQAGVAPPQPPGGEPDDEEPSADEALAGAVEAQQKLLEEFAKVADDLARVMANLEGSTFVKRLKLASREQGAIAGRLSGLAADAFGRAENRRADVQKSVRDVVEVNAREADKVSNIMDDLQAYLDRRQLPAFRTVLEEMKDLDTLGSLRQLSDDIPKEAGMSLAQAEFWSDTFDRLADDLVEPPKPGQGQQQDGQQAESVPPEVILEMMQILEDETNLREETRVAEQAKGAVDPGDHAATGKKLADRQEALADRVVGMIDRLLEEDEGEREFAQEIQLFEKVDEVMGEAAGILGTPDTGSKAIGAETEAIELLLAAQAASGGGGGGGGGGSGGGSSAGAGSTGSTMASALALVGAGNRGRGAGQAGEKDQATGTSGRVLPEEFRAGLDAYFNRYERERR